MELIRLENLTKTYYLGEVDVPVLKGVTLSIQAGEMVALMGASGSGKTTLMNILGCLDRPTSGKFWFDGEEMSELTPNQRALVRTAKLGFVFQSFNLLARTTALAERRHAVGLLAHPPAPRRCAAVGQYTAGPRRAGRPGRPRALADVRRAATARGHCAGLGQSSPPAAGRRADRQPRLAHQRGNPADVSGAQRRGDHRHPGDARPEGGGFRPSHDPHRRRSDRRGRHAYAA